MGYSLIANSEYRVSGSEVPKFSRNVYYIGLTVFIRIPKKGNKHIPVRLWTHFIFIFNYPYHLIQTYTWLDEI